MCTYGIPMKNEAAVSITVTLTNLQYKTNSIVL